MRQFLIFGLVGVLAGCGTQQRPTYTQTTSQIAVPETAPVERTLERVMTPNLIAAEGPFSQGGAVKFEEMRLRQEIRINKVEEGQLNGVRYRFYYAGSGKFAGKPGNTLSENESVLANWATRCSKDAMDDNVRCMAFLNDLTVSVHGDGSSYILVGSNHYPGSEVALRVGSSERFEASSKDQFQPPQSGNIIAQLKNGATVTTRYQEWPHKRFTDSTFQLYGFEEVYSYLQWAVKHID